MHSIKTPTARKFATEMLDRTQNKMQRRRWSDRRIIEQTGNEESRKKVRKELLDKTQNRLQGRGARRTEDRNEETKEEVKKRNVG